MRRWVSFCAVSVGSSLGYDAAPDRIVPNVGVSFVRVQARVQCAEKLYNQLLSTGDIFGITEHRFDAALELLIGTAW